jgi:hypothetical protein
MEHFAVREVVTGPDGMFVIDAKDIEERVPKRTWYPEFLIFMPGYGSFPRFQKSPTGFTGGVFEGAGTVVELLRLSSPENRRRHLLGISPNRFSEEPFNDLPALMEKINQERTEIGLSPMLPPEDR